MNQRPNNPSVDALHDPGLEIALQRANILSGNGNALEASPGRRIRVGTAGWTDPTLTKGKVFYPEGVNSAEDRLRYYASQFSLVEVDSTYYTLPTARNAELWSERTPAGFVFDLKAHALMTGQPTEINRLPRIIQDELPSPLATDGRIYGKDLPAELYDLVWNFFRDALVPLQRDGKLGSVLLQYPRWFHASPSNRETILEARRRLQGFECAVEFRNSSWFDVDAADETLQFLDENHIPFVMVDGPQGMKSSIPPMLAVTSPDLAVVRFHGRRTETWEAPGIGVEERFRYLYEAGELAEWRPRVLEAAAQAQEVHVIMNNCYGNYGTTNALEFVDMLRERP